MGRNTGHLCVVSPGIFYEQLFIEKLFMKTTHRTEYFCCKRNFAIISCDTLCYCYLRYSFSFIFNWFLFISSQILFLYYILMIKQKCRLAKIRKIKLRFRLIFALKIQCGEGLKVKRYGTAGAKHALCRPFSFGGPLQISIMNDWTLLEDKQGEQHTNTTKPQSPGYQADALNRWTKRRC